MGMLYNFTIKISIRTCEIVSNYMSMSVKYIFYRWDHQNILDKQNNYLQIAMKLY